MITPARGKCFTESETWHYARSLGLFRVDCGELEPHFRNRDPRFLRKLLSGSGISSGWTTIRGSALNGDGQELAKPHASRSND
jgi:hypothetical protein